MGPAVENAFCFIFLMSINDLWPRAGVIWLFGDIVGVEWRMLETETTGWTPFSFSVSCSFRAAGDTTLRILKGPIH